MNMDKLLQILQERGLLQKLPDKRLTTNPLPITRYIGMVISASGTGKSVTANLDAAMDTYINTYQENHLVECKARAMSLGKSLEEYIADQLAQRLGDYEEAVGKRSRKGVNEEKEET
ncbi:hypothetical protein MiSe_89330 [Microseira wollei NIES-4236]|uniref:Uncharacterized protein n=2 Tax=Microseira wollei TaxID=467598 RepID=A0AAV3XTC2_9CYAN|nr:hypothetical protein MiSe_89330 [Microseira wollei NIES-4236]